MQETDSGAKVLPGAESVLLHRSGLPMVSSKGTLVCSEVSSGTERDLRISVERAGRVPMQEKGLILLFLKEKDKATTRDYNSLLDSLVVIGS